MANLTPAVAKALDNVRRITLGRSVTLSVLDHAPIGEQGYVTVAPVKNGWNLSPGGIGESATLTICESRTITEEILSNPAAFDIGGKVYKIDADGDSDAVARPVGVNLRKWTYKVKASGEFHQD